MAGYLSLKPVLFGVLASGYNRFIMFLVQGATVNITKTTSCRVLCKITVVLERCPNVFLPTLTVQVMRSVGSVSVFVSRQ